MTKAKEVLDFLNSIEGAGYGGMASFEIARAHVKDMIAQPQTPKVRIGVLDAFLQHADKHGDTNSDDLWYRGAAWAWREAAKMIRLALPDADTRPDRNTQTGEAK